MSDILSGLGIDKKGMTLKEVCAQYPGVTAAAIRSNAREQTKAIKDLIKWAEAQVRSLNRTAGKTSQVNISNIYYSRAEWIEHELLPKLKTLLSDIKK